MKKQPRVELKDSASAPLLGVEAVFAHHAEAFASALRESRQAHEYREIMQFETRAGEFVPEPERPRMLMPGMDTDDVVTLRAAARRAAALVAERVPYKPDPLKYLTPPAEIAEATRKSLAALERTQFTRSMAPEVLRIYEPGGPPVPPLAHGEEEYYQFDLCHHERWLVTRIAFGWHHEHRQGLRVDDGTGPDTTSLFEVEIQADHSLRCLGRELGTPQFPRLPVGNQLKFTLRNRTMTTVRRPDILWVYGLRLMPDDFDLPPEPRRPAPPPAREQWPRTPEDDAAILRLARAILLPAAPPPPDLNPQPVPPDVSEVLSALEEARGRIDRLHPEALCAVCASPATHYVIWHTDHVDFNRCASWCCEVHVDATKKKLSGGVPAGRFEVGTRGKSTYDEVREWLNVARERLDSCCGERSVKRFT